MGGAVVGGAVVVGGTVVVGAAVVVVTRAVVVVTAVVDVIAAVVVVTVTLVGALPSDDPHPASANAHEMAANRTLDRFIQSPASPNHRNLACGRASVPPFPATSPNGAGAGRRPTMPNA